MREGMRKYKGGRVGKERKGPIVLDPDPRILHSGSWILCSGFWILDSESRVLNAGY